MAARQDKVEGPEALVPGTTGAGESGGGAYPNPHRGKKPKDRFLGHGGQTELFEKPRPCEPD